MKKEKKVIVPKVKRNYTYEEKITAIKNAGTKDHIFLSLIAIANGRWATGLIDTAYTNYVRAHHKDLSEYEQLKTVLTYYEDYDLLLKPTKNTTTPILQGIRFNSEIQNFLIKDLLKYPTYLAHLCDALENTNFAYAYHNFYWFSSREEQYEYNTNILRLRLAILKNDAEKFEEALYEYKRQSDYNQHRVFACFPEAMDTDVLLCLQPTMQIYYLENRIMDEIYKLNVTDKTLTFITHAKEILSNQKKEDLKLHNLHEPILLYYFLRADWKEMQAIAISDNIYLQQVTQAITAFLKGKDADAAIFFEAALKEYRKLTNTKAKYLPQFYGILHALTLLRGKEMEISKTYSQTLENNTSIFKCAYLALAAFFNMRQGAENRANELLEYVDETVRNLDVSFYFIIATQFKDFSSNNIRYLDILYNKALEQGFKWLAFELISARNKIQLYSFQTNTLEKLANKVGYPSIQTNVQKVEKWESLLVALSNLTPKSKKQSQASDSRLVWLLDLNAEQVLPREQNYTAKGGWSAGKVVSNVRLKTNGLICMTPQDVRVANRAIELHPHRPNQATLDYKRAIQELVGHPLLFLANSPTVGVKLEAEKPQLIVREVNDNYELQFNMDFKEAGINIQKQTPTHYKVQIVDNSHISVKEILGNKPILIPRKAKAQLTEVLDSLSSLIDTSSSLDATNQNLPSVEADTRPYIHLLPVGGGIHVEFYAKPFATVPPYFPIGEGDALQVAVLDGKKTRTERNLKAETMNKNFVIKQSEVLSQNRKATTWKLENVEQCLQLLLDLTSLQANDSVVVEWPKGEKFKISKVINFEHLTVNIKERNDWFEISGNVVVDEETVFDMQKLLEIAKSDQQFVELSQGKFLALTNELRRRLQEIEALMNKTKKGTLQMHPLVAPALEDFISLVPHFKADKHWKEQQNKLQKAFAATFKPPTNFSKLLRGYQTEGFEWLSRLAAWGVGACLADDMGLGKTVQALTLVQSRGTEGATLVVAPASVCRNWKAETEKFAPTLKPYLFADEDRQTLIENAGANDIIIVTYDLLQRETELFINKKFHTIILDEAQAIKNRQTKRSETAMQLQGDFKMIMTGTPLENHLGELWNLFQFINPGLLASPQIFQERFVNPIEKYKDEKRREQLKRLIKPFILRRRKDDVLKELPAKTEITLTVELSDAERAFYEALRREAVAKLEAMPEQDGNEGARHLRILAEIMRLRRAACNPQMVKPEVAIESAKLRLFGETVHELLENGHKALVFSQFVAHLDILRNYLEEKNIAYQYLDGQTPSKKRQERIEAFQAGEGDIFLISLKAGGTGLNLTAADYVIHMDPWWNPAVEDQASDRAHRFGQTRPVTVYRLVAAGTIEEKILQLHDKKRDLADSLLDGTDVSAKLSADDLMDLLKDN